MSQDIIASAFNLMQDKQAGNKSMLTVYLAPTGEPEASKALAYHKSVYSSAGSKQIRFDVLSFRRHCTLLTKQS